jgi:hypothetical protein
MRRFTGHYQYKTYRVLLHGYGVLPLFCKNRTHPYFFPNSLLCCSLERQLV